MSELDARGLHPEQAVPVAVQIDHATTVHGEVRLGGLLEVELLQPNRIRCHIGDEAGRLNRCARLRYACRLPARQPTHRGDAPSSPRRMRRPERPPSSPAARLE